MEETSQDQKSLKAEVFALREFLKLLLSRFGDRVGAATSSTRAAKEDARSMLAAMSKDGEQDRANEAALLKLLSELDKVGIGK